MAARGLLLESYARSAGTADAEIPGEVTSRRTSTRQERNAKAKRREEEEEKSKKQMQEQQSVARILAARWAQEDRTGKKLGDAGARRADSSDDEEERRDQKQSKDVKGHADEDKKREVARILARRWAEEDKRGQESSSSRKEGGWMVNDTKGRDEPRPASSSSGGSAWATRSLPVAASLAPRGKSPTQARRGKRLAGVFGFDEEEDEAGARSALELVKAKKGKIGLPDDMRSGKPQAAANDEGGVALDLSGALMRMAQFKRQCGGKRVPMPKELEAEVALAMSRHV